MVSSLNSTVPARNVGTQQVHVLRRTLTASADNAADRVVGAIPAGAFMLRPISGVYVNGVFDAGTILSVGPSTDTDLWGTLLSLSVSQTLVPLDELVAMGVTSDTTVIARLSASGTIALTVATAEVVIAYIAATDR